MRFINTWTIYWTWSARIERAFRLDFRPITPDGCNIYGVGQKDFLIMMVILALLVTSLLFGGMVLFSFGFAAFLFSALPPDMARQAIRKAFPHFYLFVFISATISAGLIVSSDILAFGLMAFIGISTLFARQILMPEINRATDGGFKQRFKYLHAASVVLTLFHIGISGLVLVRFIMI